MRQNEVKKQKGKKRAQERWALGEELGISELRTAINTLHMGPSSHQNKKGAREGAE